jgi:TRAP-type C4-dicarboxylate transport system substrate-binding protein
MKQRRTLIAAALGVAFAFATGSVFAQTKWDMPTPYTVSIFHTENIIQMANDVEKATGGKLKINVHANASLLKMNEIKRGIQSGQVQMGEILLAAYANEDAIFELDGVPFLATSYGDAMKLYKASKKSLEERLAKQDIKLLYAVPWPPQGLFSKKEIKSAADMKGLKWRAYSPSTAKIADIVGAQPVTIQQAELSQALATGVVDSYMSSAATGFDTKTFEHLKYFADVQGWVPKNAIMVSQKAFDALDKATQTALLKACADAEVRGWKLSEEKTAWYNNELKKNGMTIYPPSAQLKSDLQKIGERMTADWVKRAGPDGKAILDAYQKP